MCIYYGLTRVGSKSSRITILIIEKFFDMSPFFVRLYTKALTIICTFRDPYRNSNMSFTHA